MTGAGTEEVVQQRGCEIVQPERIVLGGEADQQPQLVLLAVVLAAEGALVRKEPIDRQLDGLAVAHASTSSPSPSATPRSGSTATFA